MGLEIKISNFLVTDYKKKKIEGNDPDLDCMLEQNKGFIFSA